MPTHTVNNLQPLSILLASSEAVGFAKTGGLGDVCGSLPQALARLGHRCALILPLYRSARNRKPAPVPTEHVFNVVVGSRVVGGRLWYTQVGDVPVWLVDHEHYFDRDDPTHGRGIYQWSDADGSRHDYSDNCERFTYFNRAVLEVLPRINLWPDVLHVNDWQTGLIPVYLAEQYRHRRDQTHAYGWHGIGTLLTIHNIAFQGVFGYQDMALAGLDWRLFSTRQLEYHGQLSFLKAGVLFADLLNAVSPTYAREIQTAEFGVGLEGVLRSRRLQLHGIVNGVDYSVWDPRHDAHIVANYSSDDLSGKALCKRALQLEVDLPAETKTPLCGVVARLTQQKGVDLILEVAPRILEEGVQLVVLGEGDPAIHAQLEELRARFPTRCAVRLGFSEPLAHRIEAGADLFLMPSAFEPSGLNQLYSLRYGTPPVVRATGGLADTVVDTTPDSLANGSATGFRFDAYTSEAFAEALKRALHLLRDEPDTWRTIQRNGMRQDWSWERSAAEYVALYRQIKARRNPSGACG
ncbi:MAG: glycogen synthase GlgA [Gemmataceae bacterium]